VQQRSLVPQNISSTPSRYLACVRDSWIAANRLDLRMTRVTELFGDLLPRDGLAVNASLLGVLLW
jgi:hypothetical protein